MCPGPVGSGGNLYDAEEGKQSIHTGNPLPGQAVNLHLSVHAKIRICPLPEPRIESFVSDLPLTGRHPAGDTWTNGDRDKMKFI